MFKGKPFTRLAVICWMLSLAAPTLVGNGGYVFGIQLLAIGLKLSIGFIFAPFHMLALASNLLFWRIVWRIERLHKFDRRPGFGWILAAFLYNVIFGFVQGTTGSVQGPYSFPGLLTLPGFYLWIFAFAFLTWATIGCEPFYPNEQATEGGSAA